MGAEECSRNGKWMAWERKMLPLDDETIKGRGVLQEERRIIVFREQGG